jgi:hypothetical protein
VDIETVIEKQDAWAIGEKEPEPERLLATTPASTAASRQDFDPETSAEPCTIRQRQLQEPRR